MRILRIITRLNIGGPSQQAILLSGADSRLRQPPHTTVVVAGQPEGSEGDLSDVARQRGVQLIVVPPLRRPIHPLRDLIAWWQLLRIMWRFRPELIHTHMAKAGCLGRFAGLLYNTLGPGRGRERRATLVHTFHGHVLEGYFSPWMSGVFVIIERWLARRTDCLIAVSPTIQQELLGLRIGRPDQWHVIRLGLQLSALAELPLPNGSLPIRVGMVGRLVPIKNPAMFLDALQRVAQRRGRETISAVVVGDGPLRQALERQAAKGGLQDRVRFTGWQRDLQAVYAELEVACLTSWNEGTPVALIEAMAAGRAVVATDVGGVRDLLAGDEELRVTIPRGGFQMMRRGLLVRPGDIEGLAAALAAVSEDELLRRRLGEEARRYAVQTFSHERLLGDLTTLYEQLRHGRARCAS